VKERCGDTAEQYVSEPAQEWMGLASDLKWLSSRPAEKWTSNTGPYDRVRCDDLDHVGGCQPFQPALPASNSVKVLSESEKVDLSRALESLRSAGYEVILSEAGPRITRQLVEEDLLDELFITLSQVLAGDDR
jgi:hypothetical protein